MDSKSRVRSEKMTIIDYLARRMNLWGFIAAITLVFFLIGILFPFYWMASSSFKTYAEIGGREPVYVPSALRLDAYRELFDPSDPSFQNFAANIVNTFKVSVPTAVIAVIFATLGAYAVARLHFKGKEL